MNKDAINIWLTVFCGHKFSNQLGKYLGVQLPDHMVGLYLALKEAATWFSEWLNHVAFPAEINESSHHSASSRAIGIVRFGDFRVEP